MTDRERLSELIHSSQYEYDGTKAWYEQCADYLLENGVIVPPCKTEEKVPEILLGYSCVNCGDFVSFGDNYCTTCGEDV